MSPADSKYTYPGTDVLRNHFGIRSASRLAHVEGTYTQLALGRLHEQPVAGSFDLPHLCAVHRAIFGDVYPFAGEIRTEEIMKWNPVRNDWSHFMPVEDLVPGLTRRLREVADKDRYRGMSAEVFVQHASKLMLHINAFHPFREGNGRTQREFIRTVALNAGYSLDWDRLEKNELLSATIHSSFDPKDLSLHSQLERALVSRTSDRGLQQAFDALSLGRTR